MPRKQLKDITLADFPEEIDSQNNIKSVRRDII